MLPWIMNMKRDRSSDRKGEMMILINNENPEYNNRCLLETLAYGNNFLFKNNIYLILMPEILFVKNNIIKCLNVTRKSTEILDSQTIITKLYKSSHKIYSVNEIKQDKRVEDEVNLIRNRIFNY